MSMRDVGMTETVMMSTSTSRRGTVALPALFALVLGALPALLLLFALAPAPALAQTGTDAASGGDASQYLQNVDELMYPDSYRMLVEIHTERPNARNTDLVMEVQAEQGVGSLMEIQEPARQRGIRFLQRDEALWIYNPRSNTRRPIRLSPRVNQSTS